MNRSLRLLLTAWIGLAGGSLWAQQIPRFAALWEKPSNVAWQSRHGMTQAAFQTAFDQMFAQGFRLVQIDGYVVNGVVNYAAIWDKSSGPKWQAYEHLTAAEFEAKLTTLRGQGYRPVNVSTYTLQNVDYYAAIWHQDDSVVWQERHGLTANGFQTAFSELVGQGYRLIDLDGCDRDGAALYAGIWVKTTGPNWVAAHDLTASEYQDEFNRRLNQGYRPRRVSGFQVNGVERFAALWDKSSAPAWVARHNLSLTDYQTAFSNFANQGYRLTMVSGYSSGSSVIPDLPTSGLPVASLQAFDDTMKSFMGARNIPAGVLAVSRQGKLILERAYGWQNPTTRRLLKPSAQFRIASLTKPLTAAAVHRLIAEGRLKLGDFAFDLGQPGGGHLTITPAGSPDARLKAITIDHLLDHTAGWDRDLSGDPMFRAIEIATTLGQTPPPTQTDFVRYMLGRPLDHNPGSTYAYSNFGYLVLGLIIEKVTGQDYGTFVQESLLGPAGVPAGELVQGRSLPSERSPREPAVYSDPGTARSVFSPAQTVPFADGGFLLEAMEAHGGLISTARAYARFLARYWIDGTPRTGNGPSFTFFGSLPGTWAVAHQRADGVDFVAFFNQRTDPSGLSYDDILAFLNAAADSITAWPTEDASTQLPSRVTLTAKSGSSQVEFPTESHRVYELLRSVDLRNWVSAGEPQLADGQPLRIPVSAEEAAQFFRVAIE